MSDQPTNEQINQVEEKPQEEMLTSEKPAETEEVSENLPEDASDRTREQFEKLKQSNKEMAERLRQLETSQAPTESVLDSLTPKQATQTPVIEGFSPQQTQDAFDKLVDSNGYVDLALLKSTMAESRKRAEEATKTANAALQELQQYTKNDQTRQTHAKYPELDPSSKSFDPNFYRLVKNELIGQMTQGRQNFMEAADEMAKFYQLKRSSSDTQKIVEKKEEQVRQINTTGTGSRANQTFTKKEDLMDALRRNKPGALAEALR